MDHFTTFFSTTPDYLASSRDAFGEIGFVLRLYNGQWQILMVVS
jgi:hypothetical protein